METLYNKHWLDNDKPRVTILTPVYNRRDVLPRAMNSVANQTCHDIEYIIVNDGSEEPLDDIVQEFMEKVDFPMAYIKKPNGGVHTARNAAIRISRGDYILFLDSDDEYIKTSVETWLKAWDSIPHNERSHYMDVIAYCMDHTGHKTNITEGMLRGDLMRETLWPEPEGVKFVVEGIAWRRLTNAGYCHYRIDDALYMYHLEQNDSFTNTHHNKRLQKQELINRLFNEKYCFEHSKELGIGIVEKIQKGVRCQTYAALLRKRGEYPLYQWAIIRDWLLHLLKVPGIIVSLIYEKRNSC